MTDALERVLELVASGRLTAQEAAPLLDALDRQAAGPMADRPSTAETRSDEPASAVRIEVTEAGRKVVNLRVPLALGRTAINRVPGLSEATSERIREAITAGLRGPILDVEDEDGDGVRVVIE
jgi:hypothetical protein